MADDEYGGGGMDDMMGEPDDFEEEEEDVEEEGFEVRNGADEHAAVDEKAIPVKDHSTTRYMTKYEKARVLGTRALQIRLEHARSECGRGVNLIEGPAGQGG